MHVMWMRDSTLRKVGRRRFAHATRRPNVALYRSFSQVVFGTSPTSTASSPLGELIRTLRKADIADVLTTLEAVRGAGVVWGDVRKPNIVKFNFAAVGCRLT